MLPKALKAPVRVLFKEQAINAFIDKAKALAAATLKMSSAYKALKGPEDPYKGLMRPFSPGYTECLRRLKRSDELLGPQQRCAP